MTFLKYMRGFHDGDAGVTAAEHKRRQRWPLLKAVLCRLGKHPSWAVVTSYTGTPRVDRAVTRRCVKCGWEATKTT